MNDGIICVLSSGQSVVRMEGRLLSEIVSLIILDCPTRNFAHCVSNLQGGSSTFLIQIHETKIVKCLSVSSMQRQIKSLADQDSFRHLVWRVEKISFLTLQSREIRLKISSLKSPPMISFLDKV